MENNSQWLDFWGALFEHKAARRGRRGGRPSAVALRGCDYALSSPGSLNGCANRKEDHEELPSSVLREAAPGLHAEDAL